MANLAFTIAGDVKNEMLNGDIDFAVDTFNAYLMRPDFSFSASNHTKKINFATNTGAINYTCVGTAKTITRSTGSFITDGFVVGNYITATGTNTGTYKITSVTATVLKISLVGAATFVDETAVGQTITSNDEHDNTGGYTPGGVAMGWTISGRNLNLDTFDMESSFGATAMAESPGFIIVDETATDDPIICYARFLDWRVSV